jgi:hypothetical protein
LRIDVASYATREVIQRRLRALAVDTIRLTGELPRSRASDMCREAGELLAITVSSIRTARVGRGAGRANPQSAIRNPQCS